jgi:alanine-glyoxylate transaminase/serine-glyoxylate transaminase/serine-pyruvate transaminase
MSELEHYPSPTEEESVTKHQGRHFLNIPGPSPVPDRVLRAMDMPVIDHRRAEFA